MRARSLAALTICSRIWASLVDTSEAAAKASSAVRFVLAKAVPKSAQAPQLDAPRLQQQQYQSVGQSVPGLFDSAAYSTNTSMNAADKGGIVGSGAGLADVQVGEFDMVRGCTRFFLLSSKQGEAWRCANTYCIRTTTSSTRASTISWACSSTSICWRMCIWSRYSRFEYKMGPRR